MTNEGAGNTHATPVCLQREMPHGDRITVHRQCQAKTLILRRYNRSWTTAVRGNPGNSHFGNQHRTTAAVITAVGR